MLLPEEIRLAVRLHARFACEYCGVTEVDAGGELTIDHFHPRSKGGADTLDNLVYCCARCNSYKHDYWPKNPSDLPLWNPRIDPASKHFLELEDGMLTSLTETGALTLRLLSLNRQALVEHRRRRREAKARASLQESQRDFTRAALRLLRRKNALNREQQQLLLRLLELLELLAQSFGDEAFED